VSSLRAAGVGDAKKRLSTIPASPASKKTIKAEDDKENDLQPILETSKGKGLARPPLGARQSTRSVAIQQRIHEYQLVSVMLRAAVAAEDAGDEDEKEQLTTEVDDAINHLKADLEVTKEASTAEKSTMLHESTESISLLESQLRESNATIGTLKVQLEELRTEVEEYRKSGNPSVEAERDVESTNAAHVAEIEELKKQHELEISSLRQKLQALELSQQEREELSLKGLEDARRIATEAGDTKTSQLLEDQKSLHRKAVEALENDLAVERKAVKDSADKVSLLEREIEEHKSNLAAATSEAEERVKIIEAHQDQLAHRDRELQGRGGVVKSLQQELAELHQAKTAEAEALKQSSTNKVVELQAQIAALKSAADRSSAESAVTDVHTQEELMRKEKEISNLGQIVERLQDEIQRVHESKSNELDEKLLHIRQEHDQVIMAMKAEQRTSIDGLAKSHNSVVDKLAVEARNTRTSHERQIQALSDERSELQKSLENIATSLEVSKKEAEKQMQEVELKHSEALEAVNEELQKAQNALADSQQLVKQTKEDSREMTASMVKTLEEKTQALEHLCAKDAAALKSTHDDLEAAHQQVESLKQALETLEKDSQSKEDHQSNSLKKAIAEAEVATKALSEQSSSLESAEKNHAKALDNLRSGYEADVEVQRVELAEKHERAFKELQAKHDGLVSARGNLEKSQTAAMEQLKVEHDRVLADSSKMIADLQQAHLGELEEIRRQLADEHLKASKQMEEEFSSRAADVTKTHHAALDNLQSTHEKTMLDLRAELEDSQLKTAATTKESHEAIVKDLQAQLERQEADLAKAQLEAQKASEQVEDPELAKLKTDLQMSNDALTAAQAEASTLANEVSHMKGRLEQDGMTISQLEITAQDASKTRADTSSREMNALKEQLDGALQEAETQRANSDIARKELQETAGKVKQSSTRIEELEAKLQAVNEKLDLEHKISTPGSTRRRNRRGGSKNSPKLSQGKWAGEPGNGEAAASPTSRKEGENLGSSVQGTVGIPTQLLLLLV
jgi:hypothetical protein